MVTLGEWAESSGCDHGWDQADREITHGRAVPDGPTVPGRYADHADRWRTGWDKGVALRRANRGVHGDEFE